MTKTITVTDYFGGCPTCGENDGYLNAGRTHIFYCREHKVSWIVGSNLFSSWRCETEAEQREKYKAIEGFERIEDPLPEGTWPADPEMRRREFEEARQKKLDEEARRERDEEARRERRDALGRKVADFLVGALTPVAADMPAGEEISISVQPNVNLILTAAGIRPRQEEAVDDDLPF